MLRRRVLLAVLPLVAVAAAAMPARGDTLIQFLGNSSDNTQFGGFAGQSFTTPSGGPWNNISFNFYADSSGTPLAVGTAFLLSKTYGGTPHGLSSSTDGYIASAAAAGNVYQFDSTIQLAGNTQYFVYVGGLDSGDFAVDGVDGYAGGSFYFMGGSSRPYGEQDDSDALFQLSGDAVGDAAPLPGAMRVGGVLLPLAFLGLAWARRKRVAAEG